MTMEVKAAPENNLMCGSPPAPTDTGGPHAPKTSISAKVTCSAAGLKKRTNRTPVAAKLIAWTLSTPVNASEEVMMELVPGARGSPSQSSMTTSAKRDQSFEALPCTTIWLMLHASDELASSTCHQLLTTTALAQCQQVSPLMSPFAARAGPQDPLHCELATIGLPRAMLVCATAQGIRPTKAKKCRQMDFILGPAV